MDEEQVIIVQETEYTGAGKHVTAQLTFARENGIEIRRGNPADQVPGKNIIIPEDPALINAREMNVDDLRRSYVRNCLKKGGRPSTELSSEELDFLAQEINRSREFVKTLLEEIE
jgi:hypothetical protein